MMKRASPIDPRVSDYIVRAVMDDEKLLIQGANARMMQSNYLRKELWEKISDRIFTRFRVRLTAAQIQTHFNNRKKRVLSLGRQEKKYRTKTGGGVSPDKEYAFTRQMEMNDEDLMIHDYFADKVANVGLRNADTMEIAERPLYTEGRTTGNGRLEKEVQNVLDVDDYEDNESNVGDEHNIDDEILSDRSTEDLDNIMNHHSSHNVSAAQLRRMEAQRIKYQTKCFDAWARQAAVQTAALRETISMMRSITEVFTRFLETNVGLKKDSNNNNSKDDSSEPRPRPREPGDPNMEGSLMSYSIIS
ncbi:hypothetical protein ANCCAN_14726 [Ancylostoma caninum]|uniref:Regulatory protein zeste n=1 Tax=Ancylostoma caninum TaxID=29170 RepID=A0A368G6P8_ANCCA|nr:hypothetical protein ANCCAN_14726 [Ancylostoma caninum]